MHVGTRCMTEIKVVLIVKTKIGFVKGGSPGLLQRSEAVGVAELEHCILLSCIGHSLGLASVIDIRWCLVSDARMLSFVVVKLEIRS